MRCKSSLTCAKDHKDCSHDPQQPREGSCSPGKASSHHCAASNDCKEHEQTKQDGKDNGPPGVPGNLGLVLIPVLHRRDPLQSAHHCLKMLRVSTNRGLNPQAMYSLTIEEEIIMYA